jgi:chromosome segregation ATPase
MPLGITESDPTKALPIVIEKLKKAQAEAQAAKKELEDWKKGKAPFDKALEELAQTLAPSGESKDWGLAWAAAYLGEVKAKIVSLNVANEWSAAEIRRLEGDVSTGRATCADYQKEVSGYISLLQQISGKLGDSCGWTELPGAVATLYQRCNQYGAKADRAGEANQQLLTEREEARCAMPIQWRPTDPSKLARNIGAFATGWESLATQYREAIARHEKEIMEAGLELKRCEGELLRAKESLVKTKEIADQHDPLEKKLIAWRWIACALLIAGGWGWITYMIHSIGGAK